MKQPVMLAIRSLTFDCNDVDRQSAFWSEALGYPIVEIDEEGAILTPPSGGGPRLLFLKVPERKSAKNRIHFDLRGGDMGTEVDRLVALGASVVREVHNPGDVFTVMHDPEGNEFCIEKPPE